MMRVFAAGIRVNVLTVSVYGRYLPLITFIHGFTEFATKIFIISKLFCSPDEINAANIAKINYPGEITSNYSTALD
jgi:hypothetical protein